MSERGRWLTEYVSLRKLLQTVQHILKVGDGYKREMSRISGIHATIIIPFTHTTIATLWLTDQRIKEKVAIRLREEVWISLLITNDRWFFQSGLHLENALFRTVDKLSLEVGGPTSVPIFSIPYTSKSTQFLIKSLEWSVTTRSTMWYYKHSSKVDKHRPTYISLSLYYVKKCPPCITQHHKTNHISADREVSVHWCWLSN